MVSNAWCLELRVCRCSGFLPRCAQVEESGVSGERVLVTMRERLATELQEASSKAIK